MSGHPQLHLDVLVADESDITRSRMVALLGELPHVHAFECGGGTAEILRSIDEFGPACVILDAPALGAVGNDVIARVRDTCDGCVLVVLTNDASPELEAACREAGAAYFLRKWADFERVKELVAALERR